MFTSNLFKSNELFRRKKFCVSPKIFSFFYLNIICPRKHPILWLIFDLKKSLINFTNFFNCSKNWIFEKHIDVKFPALFFKPMNTYNQL